MSGRSDSAVLEIDSLWLDHLEVDICMETVNVFFETLDILKLLFAALNEALVLAMQLLLSLVHTHVLLKVGARNEVLATNLAEEGTLPGVDSLVPNEVTRLVS
jgi:hypothetical protein